MNKQEKLILLGIGLFCLIFLIIGFFFSNADRFYSGAYSPMVEKSLKAKQAAAESAADEESSHSDEPRARGLREREIQKQRGDRYSTY